MNALQGRLSEGALANLVQYLALNQASGCLQLVADGVAEPTLGDARGAVYLADGRVEHVEAGILQGVPALSELLAWRQGRFAFVVGVLAPRRTLELSVDALLLHASFGSDLVANGDTVPSPSTNGAIGHQPSGPAGRRGHPVASEPAGASALDAVSVPRPAGPRPVDGAHAAPRGGRLAGALAATAERGAAVRAPGPMTPTVLADPAVVPGLVWAAVAVAGPIGEIFVDEAFETIGHTPRLLPESALGALVHAVAGRFRSNEGRAQFVARAEAVLAHHGYGRVED